MVLIFDECTYSPIIRMLIAILFIFVGLKFKKTLPYLCFITTSVSSYFVSQWIKENENMDKWRVFINGQVNIFIFF